MKEHVVYLDLQEGERILDLYAETEWDSIVLTSEGRVITGGESLGLDLDDQPRLVRRIDEHTFLLTEPRTGGPDNLHIYDLSGRHVRSFLVGDCIADVLVHRGKIIVSYFDEGVINGIGPGGDGLAVFALEGTQVFGFNSAATWGYMLDCYCISKAGPDRIIFYAYPDRVVFELDLDTLKVRQLGTPEDTTGIYAISTTGPKIVLYCRHSDHLGFYAWNRSRNEMTGIGSYPSPLKGLPNGRFLSFGDRGYTIVDVSGDIKGN